jgi:hypothetical protein
MKKKVFKMLMLAFVVMCAISFTACGGDDGENGGKPDGNPSWTFYEPFTTLDTSPGEVKAYMADKLPQFKMEEPFGNNNGYALIYIYDKENVSINYSIVLNKLSSIICQYENYSKDKYNFILSELKKRYALEVMAEQGESKMCKGVINGKPYLISIGTSEDGGQPKFIRFGFNALPKD